MSSLSSKFSSTSAQNSPAQQSSQATPNGSQHNPSATPSKPSSSTPLTPPTSDGNQEPEEDYQPYVPQQPKQNSFLSSAFRRLSSSGPSPSTKVAETGKICPRRVLNVDKGRERCKIGDLDQSRLRRVAFSVDVEVAGVSRYAEDETPVDKPKKAKDKKLMGRSEGEALKNPNLMTEKKEKNTSDGPPGHEKKRSVDDMFEAELMAAAKQQEVDAAYKRRQEKQDKKRNNVEEPKKIALPTDTTNAPTDKAPEEPKQEEYKARPTTDPVRMYRRCCQLREAPVLKRMTEQLTAIKENDKSNSGFVEVLDLNGSRMQLTDLVCLGDWLAIVPVKKLLMDNANLTDEGLRVVLAGLMAAKPPGFNKRKRGRSSPTRVRGVATKRTPGVVEKLSLKNNPKLTETGWKDLSVFINLSHSINSIDVSMIPFPQTSEINQPARNVDDLSHSNNTQRKQEMDLASVLCEALSTRSAGSRLEELVLSDCALSTYHVCKIVDGVTASGLIRLGLAMNQLNHESLKHVGRYVKSQVCRGLDLGSNDLRDAMPIFRAALDADNPLWGLSLANCNLDVDSLRQLFPSLVSLPDLRFLDLSHNQELFTSKPNALCLLRKYLPQMNYLRRIQFDDIALSPADTIGLADILPEIRNLSQVSLLQNPQLEKLTAATDPASQEDACALYASLMVAVRVSKCLIAVEIDEPKPGSNEVVKALAKQIAAYCIRNMDRYTAVDAVKLKDPAGAIADHVEGEPDVEMPEVLVHLVGHAGEDPANIHGESDIGPDQDYIISGTGVVKALSYCLGQKASDLRRMSTQIGGAGAQAPLDTEAGKEKAKEMSKNLLGSARKIRARLQAAISREAKFDDEMANRKCSLFYSVYFLSNM